MRYGDFGECCEQSTLYTMFISLMYYVHFMQGSGRCSRSLWQICFLLVGSRVLQEATRPAKKDHPDLSRFNQVRSLDLAT